MSRYKADYVLISYHLIVILLRVLERSALSRCSYLSRKQEWFAKTATNKLPLLSVLVQVQFVKVMQDLSGKYKAIFSSILSSMPGFFKKGIFQILGRAEIVTLFK